MIAWQFQVVWDSGNVMEIETCARMQEKSTNNSSDNRRKSRSQTSDNMERWQSIGGKSQRGVEKKCEDIREEEEREERRGRRAKR